MNTILKDKIFGKIEAWVYVIEFQKRGLPHIHLLVTLCRNYKITSPETVNNMICAEIPDPNHESILHEIVMHNMIHGPCGDWCLKDKKCSKHFPKQFQSETIISEDGYPSYKRENTEKYYNRPHGYVVDNRFVVPYSPILLRKFNCHCNVELVSSSKSVKYLFQYIYKGHDTATITIQGQAANVEEIIYDEINEHIEARYVGPVEACWRILSKKLQDESHPVIRMPVHLPNQQNLTIHSGDEEFTLHHILEQKNILLDYFDLNSRDQKVCNYLYYEIPCYYVFHKEKVNNTYTSKWRKRKSSFKTIGRIDSVNPSQQELFHLRLLLSTVKGATSYEKLQTVNGKLASTFTEACLKRGLIADDSEWYRAMHEAEIWMMPLQMRRLYTRILVHCLPLYPDKLWDEFKVAMSEDFANQGMNPIQCETEVLRQIYQFLEDEGKIQADFPSLPSIPTNDNDVQIDKEDYDRLLGMGMVLYKKLNEQQRIIIDTIIQNMDELSSEKTFYIDGPGGSGKTFVYITLWHLLIDQKKKSALWLSLE
uniref:ClpX_0 protein n=2 Tax=Fopius arisanus TaxID=64838 RepID=A0A0C9RGQ0_9HYME